MKVYTVISVTAIGKNDHSDVKIGHIKILHTSLWLYMEQKQNDLWQKQICNSENQDGCLNSFLAELEREFFSFLSLTILKDP
jgi:hypothetical protein